MDANEYVRQLSEAAENGDWTKYRDIQAYLSATVSAGVLNQMLAPYAPLIQKLQRNAALDETEKSAPEFRTFYGSEAYRKVLEERPKLKQAIDNAEADPQFQKDLPELYKISFELGQAGQPESSASQRWSQSATQTTPATASQPDFSREGRKRLIQELEARGIKDADLDRADPTFGKTAR